MNTAIIKKADRLTELDVHNAMDAMIAEGEKPTALNLLKVLGRGSLTTISKFMNSFNTSNDEKTTFSPPALIEIPRELNASGELLVKKIWSDARALANQEIESQRTALMQAEADAAAKIAEAMAFSEAQAVHIDELENLLDELRGIIAERDNAIAELSADVKNLTQALNDEKRAKDVALASEKATKESLAHANRLNDELRVSITENSKSAENKIEILKNAAKELDKVNRTLELQVGKQQIALDQQANTIETLKQELKDYKADCKAANELAARLKGRLDIYEQKLNEENEPVKAKKTTPKKEIVE